MLTRLFQKCLLRPEDVPPCREDFQVAGVFNPGAVETDRGIVMLARVAEQPRETRPRFIGLPRYDFRRGEVVVDWEPEEIWRAIDPRVVMRRDTETVRLTFISSLRTVYMKEDGRSVGEITASGLFPSAWEDEFGVEDPRITLIGERFHVAYVAVSRHGVSTALAVTDDFRSFERRGILFYPENKDVAFFPEKIGGKYYALHRPNAGTPFSKPEMWIASSPDMVSWGEHRYLVGGAGEWDAERIGGGTPPIKTRAGWLSFYHAKGKAGDHKGVGVYTGGALLLDLREPWRVIGRAPEIMVPEADFECGGFLPDIVFPTGLIRSNDRLLVYYGAADSFVGMVEFSLDETLRRCGF